MLVGDIGRNEEQGMILHLAMDLLHLYAVFLFSPLYSRCVLFSPRYRTTGNSQSILSQQGLYSEPRFSIKIVSLEKTKDLTNQKKGGGGKGQ